MTQPSHHSLADEDYYLRYGVRLQKFEQQGPLIDRVTNSWKDEKNRPPSPGEADEGQYLNLCDDVEVDFEDTCCDNLGRTISRSRRLRRMALFILGVSATIYLTWKWYLRPSWEEDRLYMQGLDKEFSGFGVQAGDMFHDMKQLEELDQNKIPGGKQDVEGKRRLVFVGDIHGCRTQLDELLDKVNFDPTYDHLIATGDNIAKGPDSAGVIDRLMTMGASSVRGNWEDKILLASKLGTVSLSNANGFEKETAVLSKLGPHHLEWLNSLPLILHIPAITPPSATPKSPSSSHNSNLTHPLLNDIYVAHAGLVPAVPPLRQDPFAIMNMRAIYPLTHVPSARREYGVAWEKIWNWFQTRLENGYPMPTFSYIDPHVKTAAELDDGTDHSHDSWDTVDQQRQIDSGNTWREWLREKKGDVKPGEEWRQQSPTYVIYGHDSPRGLNLKRWSKGLDSGCVNGNALSALVVDAWGRQELVQVGCQGVKK